MIKSDTRLQEYYHEGNYKGFRKSREFKFKLSGKTHITFTNGEKEIFASGLFKEEALIKILKNIDDYFSKEKNIDL